METTSETRHGKYGRPEGVKLLITPFFFEFLHRRRWLHERLVFDICEFAWKTVAKKQGQKIQTARNVSKT